MLFASGRMRLKSGHMFANLKTLVFGRSNRQQQQQEVCVEHEVLGSDYGGWPIAVGGIGPDTSIFSFGAGEDISFDLAAIERFGCNVLVFDPTPKSVAWMNRQVLPEQLTFYPMGIDRADGEVRLYSPPNPDHVSFSVNPTPSARRQFSITANVMRLESIVAQFAAGPPDIVKLDIEGFEYRVIADILSGPIRPSQLLIEFHHKMYGFDISDTVQAVNRIKTAGYRIFQCLPADGSTVSSDRDSTYSGVGEGLGSGGQQALNRLQAT